MRRGRYWNDGGVSENQWLRVLELASLGAATIMRGAGTEGGACIGCKGKVLKNSSELAGGDAWSSAAEGVLQARRWWRRPARTCACGVASGGGAGTALRLLL